MSNQDLPTYESHQTFGNETQVTRAGAMILRAATIPETPTSLEFVLVFETSRSGPDTPDLHLRIDEDQLRSLVNLVTPYLGPSRSEYRRILSALERIEKKLDEST